MPGETADDAWLARREDMSRVMWCVLDKVSSEIVSWISIPFFARHEIITGNNRNDRDQLKKMCMVCAVASPKDLLAEIEDCSRSLVHMHDAVTVPETPIDFLRFVLSYGDNVFPNVCTISYRYFLQLVYQLLVVNVHSQNSDWFTRICAAVCLKKDCQI